MKKRSSNNPIAEFLDRCTEAPADDPRFPMTVVHAAALYQAYVRFTEATNGDVLTAAKFGRYAARCLTRIRRARGCAYGPLRLKTDAVDVVLHKAKRSETVVIVVESRVARTSNMSDFEQETSQVVLEMANASAPGSDVSTREILRLALVDAYQKGKRAGAAGVEYLGMVSADDASGSSSR